LLLKLAILAGKLRAFCSRFGKIFMKSPLNFINCFRHAI